MKARTLLLLLLGFFPITWQAGALTIQGTVTDSANGQPVSGHPVYIESISNPQGGFQYNNTVLTDPNGFYFDSIPTPPMGTAALVVYTYDCMMKMQHVVVNSNQTSATVDFQICTTPGQGCQAFFNWNPHNMNPKRIFFHDLSVGNISQWLWDFGDGTSSTQKNPQHIYQQAGVYEVCLTVSNNDSVNPCLSVFCDSVYVDMPTPQCHAEFTWFPDPSNTNSLQFIDQSTGNPQIYLWDFGDGSSDTLKDPVHQFPGPGIYDVCLTIFNPGQGNNMPCFDFICKQVIVDTATAPCQADFIHWPSQQNPLKMIFQDISQGNINQWEWDFGDGSSGVGPIIDHTFPDTGSYQVCLAVSGPSCQDTLCKTINVYSPGNFNIAGQVFGGFFPANGAQVQLFRKVNGQYMLDQVTSIDSFGVYYFYQVLGGTYILRARPVQNNIPGQQFLPTYFMVSHHWFLADEIPLYQDLFGADIHMMPAPGPMNGNGTISGHVEYSDNREDGLSGPAHGIDVFLRNQNAMPLAMSTTDSSGYFEFNNVHFGNLDVHAEVTGITTIPANVNLNPANPVADNILLEIQPMMVLPVHEVADLNGYVGDPYPNPAVDHLSLPIEWERPAEFDLRLINTSGREVLRAKIFHPGGHYKASISMPSTSPGLHVLQLLSPKGNVVNKKILIIKN